ncbi:hypothetical protein DICVIV_00437 [Dictyocaulus viviparus]|uniref:Zinc finger PHD-type domain-containing protein n=1 Tax=Dictyocaulus viviparus TaxID=29172 RepID=A0A0D8YBC5_DICVI|nr:hypothetical protein DICVIV_00437 [Dictyocaulus viviparus]
MVCIIHGFPNSVAALRFEWAWQNPEKSRAIKNLVLRKARKETPFTYRLRIACHLMNCRPWNNFALTFRWLLPLEEKPFPEEIPPPMHVRKMYGLVEKLNSEVPSEKARFIEKGVCHLCGKEICKLNHLVRCQSRSCAIHFHAKCLAANGLGNIRQLLYPVQGNCPRCSQNYLWGDVIRDQRMIILYNDAQDNVLLKGLVPKMCQ